MTDQRSRKPRKTRTPAARRKPAAKTPKKKTARPSLSDIALAALEDMKAVNVKLLDVRKLTDVADAMIVASGNSDRHVKSIASRVIERCAEAGYRPFGVEGDAEGEWVLVDLQDIIVHVMLPRIREFYGLEKLWDARPARHDPAAG